jgi:sentrin-specific protease 8
VSVIDGLAFRYDSPSPSNYNEAILATDKISKLLGKPLRFKNLHSPQQQKSSDSGIYMCIAMKHLVLKRLLSAPARNKVSMGMGMKIIDVSGARKQI